MRLVHLSLCLKRYNSITALQMLLVFCTVAKSNIVGNLMKPSFEKIMVAEKGGNPPQGFVRLLFRKNSYQYVVHIRAVKEKSCEIL